MDRGVTGCAGSAVTAIPPLPTPTCTWVPGRFSPIPTLMASPDVVRRDARIGERDIRFRRCFFTGSIARTTPPTSRSSISGWRSHRRRPAEWWRMAGLPPERPATNPPCDGAALTLQRRCPDLSLSRRSRQSRLRHIAPFIGPSGSRAFPRGSIGQRRNARPVSPIRGTAKGIRGRVDKSPYTLTCGQERPAGCRRRGRRCRRGGDPDRRSNRSSGGCIRRSHA